MPRLPIYKQTISETYKKWLETQYSLNESYKRNSIIYSTFYGLLQSVEVEDIYERFQENYYIDLSFYRASYEIRVYPKNLNPRARGCSLDQALNYIETCNQRIDT